MSFTTGRARRRHPPSLAFFGLALLPLAAVAHDSGVASLGATGGLTIPSAYVLEPGDMALSLGNYQDPKFGRFDRHENYSLGFGLVPGVELFGRFVEYTSRQAVTPGARDIVGTSDISANIKWQLPIALQGLPKLAVGATDLSGGAVHFSAKYVVASDAYGPLRWSLGYARGESPRGRPGGAKVLDGVFGGAEFKLGNSGATLLAETDGTQRHAGVRYYSQRLSWLGDARMVGTLQRSFGATTLAGRAADATSVNMSLIVPLGSADPGHEARAAAGAAAQPLPAPPPSRCPRWARLTRTPWWPRRRIGSTTSRARCAPRAWTGCAWA